MAIDISKSNEFIDPPDFQDNESLLDMAYSSPVSRYGIYAGAGYGTLAFLKAGTRFATPVTQAIAKPLKEASTFIKGYYAPGVTGKEKMSLLIDHWKKADMPAVTKYLETYKDTPDPWGNVYKGGATPRNINVLRTAVKRKGGMYGLDGGIETMDELKYASRIRKWENSLNRVYEGGVDGYQIKEGRWKGTYSPEEMEQLALKRMRRNSNLLRYEMQKTELIKHSMGEKINQDRWRSSGLGKIHRTTLEDALEGNTRAIRGWKNSMHLKGVGGIDEATNVTVSQYRVGSHDHATLIRNAKNFGSSYIKAPEGLAEILGSKSKYTRVGGMKNIAEQAYRYYEQGYTRNDINRWLDTLEKNAENHKTKDMLKQFRNHHDFVDGRVKVNYSLVSTQRTVAGINADLEIWRGKGTSPQGREKMKIRGGGGTPGKLYNKLLVSDMYDVGPGIVATTGQKNLHLNVAKSTNVPRASTMEFDKLTRTKMYDALVKGKVKELAKLMPKAGKKALIKMAKVMILRRI